VKRRRVVDQRPDPLFHITGNSDGSRITINALHGTSSFGFRSDLLRVDEEVLHKDGYFSPFPLSRLI
jgi:hypothetical protein